MDILREGIEKLGINVSDEQLKQLEIFKSEIELFNPVYKLVSYEEEADLLIRHFLDCLAGVPVIKECLAQGKLADLGSGAGFPGIILAIMLCDNEIVLVERMKRRVDFLRNVILRCNLKNVRIIDRDVKEVSEQFDTVTCRAFHPVYDIMGDVERLLKQDGIFAAYKGQKSYVKAELVGLDGYRSEFIDIKVPFLDEPRMILTMERR